MASGGDTPSNGVAPATKPATVWKRERCVVVDVGDNSKIKASEIIQAVCDSAGVDSIVGCVPKAGNYFEINLKDDETIEVLSPGLTVGDKKFNIRELVKSETVVSIIHLPTYISDEQIAEKLEGFGVTLIGDIKRRKYPGTNVVDGTRHVKVRFPPKLKSLPYSMRFHDGESYMYYRVIHDGQMKVCNKCLSDDHVYKNCPENTCFKCGDFGHLSRFCEATRCDDCHKFGQKCECTHDQDQASDLEDYCEGCHRGSKRCVCEVVCSDCHRPYLDCACDDQSNSGDESDHGRDQSAPVEPVVSAVAKPVQCESVTPSQPKPVQPAETGVHSTETPVQNGTVDDVAHASPMETTDETTKRKHDDVSDDNLETGECSLPLPATENTSDVDDESSQCDMQVVKKKKSGKKNRRQRLVNKPNEEAVLKSLRPRV